MDSNNKDFCGIPIADIPLGLRSVIIDESKYDSSKSIINVHSNDGAPKRKRLHKATDFIDIEAVEDDDDDDDIDCDKDNDDDDDDEVEDDEDEDEFGNLKGFVVDTDDIEDNDDEGEEYNNNNNNNNISDDDKKELIKIATQDTIEYMVKHRVPRDIQRLMLAYWNAGEYEDRICRYYIRAHKSISKNADAVVSSPLDSIDLLASNKLTYPNEAMCLNKVVVNESVNSPKVCNLDLNVPYTKMEIMNTAGVIAFYYVQRVLFSSSNGLKRTESLLKSDRDFKNIMDQSQSIVERLGSDIADRIKIFNGSMFYELLRYASIAHELRFYRLQHGAATDKRIVVRTSCVPMETTLADAIFITISRDEIDNSSSQLPLYGCYLQSRVDAWMASVAHASAKIHPHVMMYSENNDTTPYFTTWAIKHKSEIANGTIKPLDFIRIHKMQLEKIWLMWQKTYLRFLKLIQSATNDIEL